MMNDDLPDVDRRLIEDQLKFLNSDCTLLANAYGYDKIKIDCSTGVSTGISWSRVPSTLSISIPEITLAGLTRELAKHLVTTLVENIAHPDEQSVYSEEMFQRLFFTPSHILHWQPIMANRFHLLGFKESPDRLDISYEAVVNLDGVPTPVIRPLFLVGESLLDGAPHFSVRMSDRIVLFKREFLDSISDSELDVLMELIIAKLTAGPGIFCVPNEERMSQLEDMAFGPIPGSPEIYNDMQDRLHLCIERF